jgi:hypothetical protein
VSRRAVLALPVLAALLGLAPAPAAASSPLLGSVEFRTGPYRPDVDGRFTLDPGERGPYQKSFGNGRPWGFNLHVARALPWRQYGTIELGGGAGYWAVKGQALDTNDLPTSESTALKMIPMELSATWRADLLWDRWRVPFVPYLRVAYQHYAWWITGPGGSTVKSGGTNGYSYGGGLGLMLDLLDPMLAREFDADVGINHTLLIVDVAQTKVDDWGSSKSFNLSDSQPTYTIGLLFVF